MREVHLLTFHWGWLSPGCYKQLRHEQGSGYLAYLHTLPPEHFGHIAFNHAGWMFDQQMPPEVRSVPGQELEPNLHVAPFSAEEVAAWRREVAEGRLEPVTYYYTPLVAEQATGELLVRAIRYSREVIERELGIAPVALTTHDPFTMMHWGTAQQVQLAALTGHTVMLGGLECMVVGMDGTCLPCVGVPVLRYGIDSMSGPMIEALEKEERDAFFFATEMHWHHRTNPFENALQQIGVRFGQVHFVPCRITEWMQHVRNWPEVPATGLGSKGWNGGGPDQMQLAGLTRACELLLPGLEALESLRPAGRAEKVTALWKRTLFLSDNHIHWFVHDHKRIYLPAARALLSDVHAAARDSVQEMSLPLQGNRPRLVAWNLLGWDQTGVAEAEVELPAGATGLTLRGPVDERPLIQLTPLEWGPEGDLRRARVNWVTRDLPAWGYRAYDVVFSTAARGDRENDAPSPLVLENARLRATFAANGEIVTLADKRTNRTYRGGHRLLNLIARPAQEELTVQAGRPLTGQGGDAAGCFSASAEVLLPQVAHYDLDLDEMNGCLLLVEVDTIGRDGAPLAPTRRVPVINLHWSGAPHRYTGARTIPLGELASGTRLRITLWFLSEGQSTIGAGAVRSQRHHAAIDRWEVHWIYRLAEVAGEPVSAEILEQGPVRQRLRFRGKLPQCSYETIATLAGPKGAARIDFETRFTFAEPTHLGIPTPPVPPEIGSYLGSNCERPYIPGLAVTFPVPSSPELTVDAPYGLRDPRRSVHPVISEQSWLADDTEPIRDFWWGLSPFTAVRYVAVRGWGGLIADGFPHFFLWRGLSGSPEPQLGLSFGASLIHPRTVTKRPARRSEWFDFGRGPGYADFQDGSDSYEFNHPHGRYIYRYSMVLETDPLALWREAREVAVPPLVASLPPAERTEGATGATQAAGLPLQGSLMRVDAGNVLLTGCEWMDTGKHTVTKEEDAIVVRLRLVEMAGRDTACQLECARGIRGVEPGMLPIETELAGPHHVKLVMPANGVRELLLYLPT